MQLKVAKAVANTRMSLPPEDTDLSTNSAHESALQIASNVSAARVVGSAVGQRFSPSPAAHPNVIERVASHVDSRRSTFPSWGNPSVAPRGSEEAAANATATQLLWAENQGLPTSHLLPTEQAFETLNTNAYCSPPGDSRFTFPSQNYSPLLPRCVPVPNQRYSPDGSPIHQLHELQNCPLIDSPIRLRFPSPLPEPPSLPTITLTVDALIDLDQNNQVAYYVQQYNNQPVLYQQNIHIGTGIQLCDQASENNQPIILHIVEHNPQTITESQEQFHQVVPEIQINNIQEQDQKFENGISEQNHPIATEAQDQTLTEIRDENQIVLAVQEKNLTRASEIQDQNQQTLTEIPEKCLQIASPVTTDIQVQSPQVVIEIQEQNHQSVTEIQEEVHQTAPEIQVNVFQTSSDIQGQNHQIVTEEQNHQTITENQEDYSAVSEIQWENLSFSAEIQEQNQQIVTEVTKLASPSVTDIQAQSPQSVIEIQDDDDEDLKFESDDLHTIPEIQEKNQQSPQFVIEIHYDNEDLKFASDNQEQDQQTAELQKERFQFASEIEKRDLQIVTDTHKQNHHNVTDIPFATYIQEENEQLTPEDQEEDQHYLNFEGNQQFQLQKQDQLSVPQIQKQTHQFESKVKKRKLQPFSEYQQKGQKGHIQERQYIQQEFTIHSNQAYSKVQYIQTIQTATPYVPQLEISQENSFEVQPAYEVNEGQRDRELVSYTGHEHQNFVDEVSTPLPPAEAQPGSTPEDISDPVSPENWEQLESLDPSTICIRKTFNLIRDISESLVADPEQPEAEAHRKSIFLLRQKLADVCHKVLTEIIHGRATDEIISILREILEQTKEIPPRPTPKRDLQEDISMGLEILKKIRGMLSGWYSSRESETDSTDTGTGFQAQNGKGFGAGRQPENSFLSQKRR